MLGHSPREEAAVGAAAASDSSRRSTRSTAASRSARRSSSAASSTRAGTRRSRCERIEQLGLPLRQKVGQALGRPAGAGRAHARAREAAGAAPARRAGRLARPARSARVPADDDGGRRRHRDDGRPLLAHRRRPRAGLRPPVILSQAETQLVGPIDEVVASHRLLTGPRSDSAAVARVHEVIRESHTERQTTLLVRANGHVYDSCWELHEVDLEEIVLAYLGQAPPARSDTRTRRERRSGHDLGQLAPAAHRDADRRRRSSR